MTSSLASSVRETSTENKNIKTSSYLTLAVSNILFKQDNVSTALSHAVIYFRTVSNKYLPVCLEKATAAGNIDKRAPFPCYLLFSRGIDKRARGRMHISLHLLYYTTVRHSMKVSVESSGENNNPVLDKKEFNSHFFHPKLIPLCLSETWCHVWKPSARPFFSSSPEL